MYSKKELLDYCVKYSGMAFDPHHTGQLFCGFKAMHYTLNAMLSELGLPQIKTCWHPNDMDNFPDGDDLDTYYTNYDSPYSGGSGSIVTDVIREVFESLGGICCADEWLTSYISEDCRDTDDQDGEVSIEDKVKAFTDYFSEWLDKECIEYFTGIMSEDSFYSSFLCIYHLDGIDRVLARKLNSKEKKKYSDIIKQLSNNLYGCNRLSGYDPIVASEVNGKKYIIFHPFTSESWWADDLGIGIGFLFSVVGFYILDRILGGEE